MDEWIIIKLQVELALSKLSDFRNQVMEVLLIC